MIATKLYGQAGREAIVVLAPLFPARPRERLLELLERFDDRKPRGIVASISPIVRRRTLQQNRLYRAWLALIGEELGYGKEELEDLHYALKRKVLGVKDGPLGPVPNSTRDLSTVAFGEFLEAVRRVVLVEFSIRLPDPDEFDAYLASKGET